MKSIQRGFSLVAVLTSTVGIVTDGTHSRKVVDASADSFFGERYLSQSFPSFPWTISIPMPKPQPQQPSTNPDRPAPKPDRVCPPMCPPHGGVPHLHPDENKPFFTVASSELLSPP
ncbi:hypothetical protein [Gloeobacter kilaueensis]|uniref:hypothetical protein n=1 Tax=Gloeobacter kilaueensis TaxID=1416614 RepID=UPI0011828969|nr:hypothetical protein [Gloeobacter kilaueensis]